MEAAGQFPLPRAIAGAIITLVLSSISCLLYNLYFHPLKDFPGPLLGRVTRLYSAYCRASGISEAKALEWHNLYGSVVRIAPDELSFNSGSAWEDIYGTKTSKLQRLQKDPHFYMGAIAPNGAAGDEDHSRIRSVIAHGFSDRALRTQEGLIRAHVNRLVQRLRHLHGKPTDTTRWLHHLSYDVIAHLCFGQDQRALESDEWFPPAKVVFEGIREGVTLVEILRYVPFKATVLNALVWAFGKARRQNFDMSVSRAKARLDSGDTDNVDFISYILRARESVKELTSSELTANVCLLIDAGSETTATMLSGCLFYLAMCPATQGKLSELLRAEFVTADQMTLQSLARVRLLTNVLQESLRVYPSLPAALPRVTPPHGAILDGVFVPGNMKVGVNQLAAYHSEQNFADAKAFIPERWQLEDERFAKDKRHVHQPFSLGSRGCLGKNLAWAEMRLLIACVLWHFDVVLEPGNENWHKDQRTWFIWDKQPLPLRFLLRNELH